MAATEKRCAACGHFEDWHPGLAGCDWSGCDCVGFVDGDDPEEQP